MKLEKGVTLISLVIYMFIATIVISVMALLSTHFLNNVGIIKTQNDYVVQYNKFNMVFVKDVKSNKSATVTENKIVFEDGTQYEYKNNAIYRNDKKVATNVQYATFTPDIYTVNNVIKNLIRVNLNIGTDQKNYKKQIEYVLKYW